MFHTIKRILDIAGDQKKYIYAGIVCNILKTFSMAMVLMAVYVVISHLDSLTAEVIGQGLGHPDCQRVRPFPVPVAGGHLYERQGLRHLPGLPAGYR